MAVLNNFRIRLIVILFLIYNICNVLGTPIVGGEILSSLETVNNYSYMVSLQELQTNVFRNNQRSTYNHICGGILIESILLKSFWKLFILTAAHCVLEKDIKNLAVVIGEHDLESESIEELPVSDIHIYEFNRYSIKNDIALIEVNASPMKYDFYNLKPLKFTNNKFEPNFKASCMILGYGSTNYAGPISRYLRKASVNLITNKQCTNVLGFIMGPREGDNTICAMGEKQDTCQGDSGGPLICINKNDKTDFLFALVSHGINCGGEGIPSVYTMVHKYLDWINSIVQDN